MNADNADSHYIVRLHFACIGLETQSTSVGGVIKREVPRHNDKGHATVLSSSSRMMTEILEKEFKSGVYRVFH